MYWVVQENIRDEQSYDDFISALTELEVSHTVVSLVPFSHEMNPEVVPTDDRVIVMGSISMSEAARKRGWLPGTWTNENFDQRVWTKAYGSHCLNADAEFCTMEQIQPFDGLRFMRPVHDFKSMSGSLVNWDWVKQQQDHLSNVSVHYREDRRSLCHDTPVSLSADKRIHLESRFFIVGGKVLAGSHYRCRGERKNIQIAGAQSDNMSRACWDFAQTMTDLWQPTSAFVLDTALVADGERWVDKVIEINCINHSGFYAADMRPVIKAIEEMN